MTNRKLKSMTTTSYLKVTAGAIGIFTVGGLLMPRPSQAALLNPGFEDGLANWTPTGDVSIDMGALGSGPPFDSSQALLTTASLGEDDATTPGEFNFSGTAAAPAGSPPILETAVGLSAGDLDRSPLFQAFEGSAIVQDFTALEGETISFNWNFLTNDANAEPSPSFPAGARDYAFVVLDNTLVATLADTGSTLGDSSTVFNRETGFQEFTSDPLSAGDHTIAIGVVDIQDTNLTSALLVDAPQEILVPEPSFLLSLMVLGAMGVGSVIERKLVQYKNSK